MLKEFQKKILKVCLSFFLDLKKTNFFNFFCIFCNEKDHISASINDTFLQTLNKVNFKPKFTLLII